MSVALPDQLDPWRAVKSGLSLDGSLSLTELPRVSAVVLVDGDGESPRVEYRLSFERDAEGRACVRGWIRTQLRLQCQRCLGEVAISVDVSLAIALLASELGLDSVPSDMEPWIVEEDRVFPRALIEDELLLAIPVVPRHELEDCHAPSLAQDAAVSEVRRADLSVPDSPFAVLADLKGIKRDS